MRRAGRPAFSLLEVLLVVALLAMLAAMTWPALEQRIRSSDLGESANNVRAALRMARATACLAARRYRFRFEPEVQQPFIEYEVDPINQPGKWQVTDAPWAESPVLLGDVNIVEIKPGRPEYLTPVSYTADIGGGELTEMEIFEEEEDQLNGGWAVGASASPSVTSESEKIDEYRPTITFEIDGSCDWYTLILARAAPGDPLEPEQEQVWIVLDGRTGLPRLQQPLTEEQMADLEIRPDLDKLQPPDTPLDELTLTAPPGGEAGGPGGGGMGAAGRSEDQSESLGSLHQTGESDLPSADGAASDATENDTADPSDGSQPLTPQRGTRRSTRR